MIFVRSKRLRLAERAAASTMTVAAIAMRTAMTASATQMPQAAEAMSPALRGQWRDGYSSSRGSMRRLRRTTFTTRDADAIALLPD